jgi:myosin heavy subunit
MTNKSKDNNSNYLSVSFKMSINELMKELLSTNCQFIRCLKPNEFQRPNYFN